MLFNNKNSMIISACLLALPSLTIAAPTTEPQIESSEIAKTVSQDAIAAILSDPGVVAALDSPLVDGKIDVDAVVKAANSIEPRNRPFGVDFVAGVPFGAGIELSYTLFRTVEIGASATSLGVANAVGADAKILILRPFFKQTVFTPTIGVSFRRMWTTPLANDAVGKYSSQLGLDGSTYDFSDIQMNTIEPYAGFDIQGKKGFHFGMSVGRAYQLGAIQDIPLTIKDYDLTIHNQVTGLQSYTVKVEVGGRFGFKKKKK